MKKLLILMLLFSDIYAEESICFGTTKNGKLQNGVKLPSSGNNFISYSKTAELFGRTYVHSKVRTIIQDSYKWLETELPDKVYKYAETGYKAGGKFRPHKTHQNGLSVDFIVPVINKNGKSVHLSTHYFNKLGYAIEFDNQGKYSDYQIDFTALAGHIVSLHKATVKQGINLWRVIFDPVLQPHLMKTKYGFYLKNNVKLSKKKSWVRHDEHYHVDFAILCK